MEDEARTTPSPPSSAPSWRGLSLKNPRRHHRKLLEPVPFSSVLKGTRVGWRMGVGGRVAPPSARTPEPEGLGRGGVYGAWGSSGADATVTGLGGVAPHRRGGSEDIGRHRVLRGRSRREIRGERTEQRAGRQLPGPRGRFRVVRGSETNMAGPELSRQQGPCSCPDENRPGRAERRQEPGEEAAAGCGRDSMADSDLGMALRTPPGASPSETTVSGRNY